MAHYNKGGGDSSLFGKNEYRRSTVGLKYDPATVAASTIPVEEFSDPEGVTSDEKILQSGEVLAKITSGPEEGLVGPFQTGATDGRGDTDNIVGVNDTFAPWQLTRRNVDVGVCYEGTLVQSKCFIRDAAGARVPLDDTTAAALVAKKTLGITFR